MWIYGVGDPVAFALAVVDFAAVQPCSVTAGHLWVLFALQH